MTAGAISSGPKATIGARLFLGLFFGVFLAVGVLFGASFFGKAVLNMISARGWTETSCEILRSGVRESAGDNSPVYRVDVTYRYDVDGRSYVGDRYKFVPGSSSGRRGKVAIVGRLPPGTRTPCYVNPKDPSDAVIERNPTSDLWFAIIPLIFTIIGAVGVSAALLARGPLASQILPSRPSVTHVAYASVPDRGRPTLLRPTSARGLKFIGIVLFSLVWNGVLAVFLWQLYHRWTTGSFLWPLAIFLIPFVVVGIVVTILGVHQALAYFNPRPLITVSSPVIQLGEELKLTWAIDGRVDKLRRLTITLEGREEATYRRGTTSHTDRQLFARFDLVEQVAPASFGGGTARVTIPVRSMHSFEAPNNKIVWRLRVRGDIRNWPDSDDEFPLSVSPRDR